MCFLANFCLVDLSIGVTGILKSPTIIVLLLIFPFILVSICLIYCNAPMLGVHTHTDTHTHIKLLYLLVGLIFWLLCNVLLCVFSWTWSQSLFYLMWVLLLLLSFHLHLHIISFPSPSLSVCMCPLVWGGSLVDSIYRGLIFVSIQPVFWLGHSTHLHLR